MGAAAQGVFAVLAYRDGASTAFVLIARSAVLCLATLTLVDAARRAAIRRRLPTLLPAALLHAAQTGAFYVAVSRASPGIVTIIAFVFPVLALAGGAALGRTRLTAGAVGVAALALAGVVVTVGAPHDGLDRLGIALALLAAVLFTGYLLCVEGGLGDVGPFGALAVIGPISVVGFGIGAPLVSDVDVPDVAGILWTVVGVSLVASLGTLSLQLAGLRRLGSGAGSLVMSLEIISAVGLSALVLGDPIGAGAVIGGTLVGTAAVLAPRVVVRRAPVSP